MSTDEQKRLQELMHDDPEHIYSDEELDQIEEIDVSLALRIARAQHFAEQNAPADEHVDTEVTYEKVAQAIEEARGSLNQDGGDIELVAVEDRDVIVRLKGACVGCPSAPLDLRNVVERLVRKHAPGVASIRNQF
jgi:toxin CptA